MEEANVPPHVVEKVLNHISGTFSGVAGTYNRFSYDDEKRRALDAWAYVVAHIVDDRKADNDVSIR